jgi:hypothetical protein
LWGPKKIPPDPPLKRGGISTLINYHNLLRDGLYHIIFFVAFDDMGRAMHAGMTSTPQ